MMSLYFQSYSLLGIPASLSASTSSVNDIYAEVL